MTTTLQEKVSKVLTNYRNEIKSFAQIIKTARPTAGDIQSELLTKMDVIFAVDKELQEALKKVNEQQSHLVKMQILQDEYEQKTRQEKQLVDQVFENILTTKKEIQREEEKLRMLETLNENGLNVNMLLALGERLSLTQGPPEGWHMDQPLILQRPPYPTEDLMRSSRLFQLMNVGITECAVEEKSDITKEDETERGKHTRTDEEPSFLDLDLNPDLL